MACPSPAAPVGLSAPTSTTCGWTWSSHTRPAVPCAGRRAGTIVVTGRPSASASPILGCRGRSPMAPRTWAPSGRSRGRSTGRSSPRHGRRGSPVSPRPCAPPRRSGPRPPPRPWLRSPRGLGLTGGDRARGHRAPRGAPPQGPCGNRASPKRHTPPAPDRTRGGTTPVSGFRWDTPLSQGLSCATGRIRTRPCSNAWDIARRGGTDHYSPPSESRCGMSVLHVSL